MRSNIIFTTLAVVSSLASAQQLTPQAPLANTPVATPNTAATQVPAGISPVRPPVASPLAPGVVSLSDVARQPNADAAPKVGAIQPTAAEVQAITLVDGNGQPIDAARAKLRSGSPAFPVQSSIMLYRISNIGAEQSALLWVKGQYRRVVVGSSVLTYTVNEINDDGVCLVSKGKQPTKAKAKAKQDKCAHQLTFIQGDE